MAVKDNAASSDPVDVGSADDTVARCRQRIVPELVGANEDEVALFQGGFRIPGEMTQPKGLALLESKINILVCYTLIL
jgi:hypothetical protein